MLALGLIDLPGVGVAYATDAATMVLRRVPALVLLRNCAAYEDVHALTVRIEGEDVDCVDLTAIVDRLIDVLARRRIRNAERVLNVLSALGLLNGRAT